jgi:hypothetical protein
MPIKTNLLQGKPKETRFLRVSGGVKKPGFFPGKNQFVAGKTKRNPVSESFWRGEETGFLSREKSICCRENQKKPGF